MILGVIRGVSRVYMPFTVHCRTDPGWGDIGNIDWGLRHSTVQWVYYYRIKTASRIRRFSGTLMKETGHLVLPG